jgi:hypothetical protein
MLCSYNLNPKHKINMALTITNTMNILHVYAINIVSFLKLDWIYFHIVLVSN